MEKSDFQQITLLPLSKLAECLPNWEIAIFNQTVKTWLSGETITFKNMIRTFRRYSLNKTIYYKLQNQFENYLIEFNKIKRSEDDQLLIALNK